MKYGNFFTQILIFSLKKVDDLRPREREREQEEKGTTNSAPRSMSFVTVGKARLAELSFSTFGGTPLAEFSKAPPLLVLACSEKQYRDLLLDW